MMAERKKNSVGGSALGPTGEAKALLGRASQL